MNPYKEKFFRNHYIKHRRWEVRLGYYMFQNFAPQSVLDLGCGIGSFLEGFLRGGCKDVLGIELSFETAKRYFVKMVKPFILKGDATSDLKLNRTFDCVISFEVGEHILPETTPNFIRNLVQHANKYIIMTAAPPGQGGTNHINLREKEFWIKEIEEQGVKYEDKIVEKLRKHWTFLRTPRYILKNLMVFKKYNYEELPNS